MSKKKNIIFNYFDKNCYGELKKSELQKEWWEPNSKGETFAYEVDKKAIFYGDSFFKEVSLMFGINKNDFESLFKEWFDNHYGLPVSFIM
jgi:hypothetical protein